MDPSELYTIDRDVEARLTNPDPVMIHLLGGFIDAGAVARQLVDHLLEVCEGEVLVTFDHDQLHDYRSRRPPMVFDTNTWAEVEQFELAIYLMKDAHGQQFLLFVGPEPDTQWERCCAAVLDVCRELGVRRLLTANAVPMGVPHTRPILISGHATDPSLVEGAPLWLDRVTVPGSFAGLLEFRAGRQGMIGQGFVAQIPHYVAQGRYAPGASALLFQLAMTSGLSLPSDALEDAADEALRTVAQETATDSELSSLVDSLEQQYDEQRERGATPVPTADEIGEAAERFLAQRRDDTEQE